MPRSQRDLSDFLRKQGVKEDSSLPLAYTVQPVSIVTDDSDLIRPLAPARGFVGTDVAAKGAGAFGFVSVRPKRDIIVKRFTGQCPGSPNDFTAAGVILNLIVADAISSVRTAQGVNNVGDPATPCLATVEAGGIGDQFNPLCWPLYVGNPVAENVDWWIPSGFGFFVIAQTANLVMSAAIEWIEPRGTA